MENAALNANPTPVHFLNLEYIFRLLYELMFGGGIDSTGLAVFFAHLWLWVIFIGYLITLIAIGVLVYVVIRIYELRAKEEEVYGPLPELDHHPMTNQRWHHIEGLMESINPSDWRQAIIEADIYLGDILTREGYIGTVGEQLKRINRNMLSTIDDAWEAHRIRNDIAHKGSEFELTETIARRTIARYENVFRELQVL